MRLLLILIMSVLVACGGSQSPSRGSGSDNASVAGNGSGGGTGNGTGDGTGGDTGNSSGDGSGNDGDGDPNTGNPDSTSRAQLRVISNRPDLISAGDVLVEVLLDSAEDINGLVLTRNGVNVTSVLEPVATNPLRLLGVIAGLDIGDNAIATNIGNSVAVTNHPVGGPVFTGPQIQPWVCQSGAVDAQCNQPVEYIFQYKSTDSSQAGLLDYDPENPPNDVADTTTENGETVPFIVRRESGYQARDQYYIFTLHKEDEEWTPANPQSQWNRQLLVTHGGNCRGDHDTSSPRIDDYAGTIPTNPAIASSYITALGLGWSVLSTAQLNLGHNCNVSYQAESLMMAKERFIEQYGELRYTVGTGCSGGAISQNMIANAYPGLYQGLLTTCTYPDVMSTATQFADYHILLRYFGFSADVPEQPNDFDSFVTQTNNLSNTVVNSTTARDGTQYSATQQNAIYGHENGIVNASLADSALFSEAVNPASGCGGVSGEERFDKDSNTDGVRCDVLTFMKNMVGAREQFPTEDPRDHWSQIEKDLGFAFAGFPLGNEGVQYGLLPLQEAVITPAQFLALNTNIGGLDPSLNVTAERLKPDYPALPNAYRTGILNTAVNMDTVPIINMTGPDPGAAHDSVHGYWLRHRLVREFTHRDNFVHWGGPTVLIGDPNYMNDSLVAMDGWLDAIEADTSDTALAQKIVQSKPATLQDQCSGVQGEMCSDEAMLVFGTPRTQAGDDIFGDQVQCQLRPFDREDNYGLGNTVWTESEWMQLEATFSRGVCDWSKKPLEWQPTITWLSYQDELGNIVTGGTQMEPADFPPGWASPAFDNTWEPGWQTTQ